MKLSKGKLLSGSALKLIAVIAMLIDHTALVLSALPCFKEPVLTLFGQTYTLYFLARKVGRIAFPLFCFLIAEGFYHTKKPKKYILTLALFAVLSEIPFNLMVGKSIFYLNKQNVYFTLCFGAVLLYILSSKLWGWAKLICSLAIMGLTLLCRSDYGLNGVLLIALLYLLRHNWLYQFICSLPFLSGGYAAWAGLLIAGLYNGKRGFIKGKVLKYAFYIFYPVHILALVLIKKYLIS